MDKEYSIKNTDLDIESAIFIINKFINEKATSGIQEVAWEIIKNKAEVDYKELETSLHQWFFDNSGVEISVDIARDLKKRLKSIVGE
jgi:hypothetical protein